MKKKKLLIALVAVLAIFVEIFFLPYRYAAILPRRMYTEDDRTVYLTYFSSGARETPSVKYCASKADFACEATVLTDGEKKTKDGDFVQFKMLVNDIWFGMPHDQILDIVIGGDPGEEIRPVKGDRIIIFAYRATKEGRKRYGFEYGTVDKAYGIYIINPDGKLFSLSKVPDFMTFEGQPPAVLKEHIREIRRELKKEK